MNWKILQKNWASASKGSTVSEIITQILFNRGIKSASEISDFLEAEYEKQVHDPFLFLEMDRIVDRIKDARDKNEKVLVFGDYDADGITSAVIIRETLADLGLNVEVYIPDKKSEGYGLNISAIENFGKNGISLIISVDCGITGIKEVEKAKEFGIDVIITDHHHIPEILPRAYAIINPKIEKSGYPFSELAGVGVAFKLSQAIYEKLLPEKKDQVKWMLDLVAIGTVADCVPLVGENRVLVKYGLVVLAKTKRVGLQQVFAVARLNIDQKNPPSTRNIAFNIAPRINAAGRINHANLAYYLLIEKNIPKARELALELEDNNSNRQKMTEAVVGDVRVLVQNMFRDKKFIFAAGENFPIGIVGLVAGKIAQEFNKPTAILQKGETESKGSFRSIPQVNIIESIEKCSDLLLKFGGHSQAAGISIENSKLEEFYSKFDREIENVLEGKDLTPELQIDVEVSPLEADYDLALLIEKLKPFGEGNPEPILMMRNLLIEDLRILGKGEKHIKFNLRSQEDETRRFDAIAFYMAEEFSSFKRGDSIDMAFNLQKDDWNGNRRVQLVVCDIKLA